MVLRSATHIQKYSKSRKSDPGPKVLCQLPMELRKEYRLGFSASEYDLHGATVEMLRNLGPRIGP